MILCWVTLNINPSKYVKKKKNNDGIILLTHVDRKFLVQAVATMKQMYLMFCLITW